MGLPGSLRNGARKASRRERVGDPGGGVAIPVALVLISSGDLCSAMGRGKGCTTEEP
jgi:hypothetical protein